MLDPPPQAAALSLCTPAGPLSPSHPAVLEIKVPLPARRARPGRIPGTQRAERALTPCWAGKDRAPACWGGGHRHPPCTETKSSWSAMKETGCFGGGEAGKTTAGCSTGWGEPLGTPLPSTTFTMPARSPSGDAVPPDLGTNIAGTGTVRGGWRAGRRGPPAHTKRLQPRSPRPPLPMPRGCCSLTPCAGEAGAC